MVKRGVDSCRWALVAFLGAFVTHAAMAVDEGDVENLNRECEMAREEALAPIREQRTRACIEQQLRTVEACETYYKTYGNVGIAPTGAPTSGYFFDLPPCKAWLKAREDLRLSNSEP